MSRRDNAPPWGTAFGSVVSFLIYRLLAAANADPFGQYLFGGVALACALHALLGLISAFRWGRTVKAMQEPTGLYGPVDVPGFDDLETMGLSFSNQDGNGIPVGGDGKRIAYYRGPAPVSYRAATNAGKTESGSAPICFALGAHRNIVATAKGAELAYIVAKYRRDVLKQNVYIVDPWGLMKGSGLSTHNLNPIGHLPRYAETGSPELLDKVRGKTLQLLPEPEGASGENRIFRVLARDFLSGSMAAAAVFEHEDGELCCNLPYLAQVLGGSHEDLLDYLRRMRGCDHLGGSIRRTAERFLSRLNRSPKFAESILSEVNAALALYDAGGPLAAHTEYSDFDPADLKRPDKPTSVFFVVPTEKTVLYGPHVGLCVDGIVDVCIEANRFEPRVTCVLDEFAALGVLSCAQTLLYQARSKGIQLVSFVQDTESFSRYGKEASAFTTQSELVIAWAIRSTKDAKEYSERSGQRSVVVESVGMPGQSDGAHSINLSEKGIPIYRPDDFLHLPDFTAAVFYKQNPPIIMTLASYRMVDPWRTYAQPVPGAPPMPDVPVLYRA